MPLQVFNLGMFRRLTKDLSDDTIFVIQSSDEEDTYYEQNCNGIKFYPASLDAPAALILEPGQEITEDHYLISREDAYLENGVGKLLMEGR